MAVRILKKYNKYHAIRTQCWSGHSHPSKGESQHCDILHLEMKCKTSKVAIIEYEKSYDLIVNGTLVCRHKPDWTLTLKDNSQKIVEFKGKELPDWKLKKKLFEILYPSIPYEVVKK